MKTSYYCERVQLAAIFAGIAAAVLLVTLDRTPTVTNAAYVDIFTESLMGIYNFDVS